MLENAITSISSKFIIGCVNRFIKPTEKIVDINHPVEAFIADNLKNKGYKFSFMRIHKLSAGIKKKAIGRKYLLLTEVYYDKSKELILVHD